MNTYIILDEGPDGIATSVVTGNDVVEAVANAVKIYGLDVANVLAVIKK